MWLNRGLFFLLLVSTVLVVCMFFFVVRLKQKKQIHLIFIVNLILMICWNSGIITDYFLVQFTGHGSRLAMAVTYIGVIYLPVALMFTGIIFGQTKLEFKYSYLTVLIPPTVSFFIVTTNFHQLFYNNYVSLISINNTFGSYFIIHTVISYSFIFIGLYLLIYFSIKNAGFFTSQSILIVIGSSLPIFVNLLYTTQFLNPSNGFPDLTSYATPSAFSFAILCYILGVLKYNFLNIAPIALQKVVDHISDCFAVLDDDLVVVDFNQTLAKEFEHLYKIRRSEKFINILNENQQVVIEPVNLSVLIQNVKETQKPEVFEIRITTEGYEKFFTVEINPIYSMKRIFIGVLVLLKDITEYKKNLETIKENQLIILEQERLASLGQLIGGIAHNLKTPIMSLAGGIEALKDLVEEYEQSIDDLTVTEKDHHEIAEEMMDWLEKMKPYCGYMSDIISAVKGQAVQMNASTTVKFTVDELVKRVDLLMKHELKKFHCAFRKDFQIDMNTEIKGEINNLVQVFDNIIMNSVQAYEGKEGIIDFKIVSNGDNIEFIFSDYAKGIPQSIADKLFKEMITTKGKNGTGLGLYMSYSTIKGRFGGNMTFTSTEGRGTTFLIAIPCITYHKKEEAV